ncbi:MAG TPA: peptidoglycan-binding protein [Gemmataceae bacterium]|nr:peptidoglycan-binding protein [Gemmataceae bacterium]
MHTLLRNGNHGTEVRRLQSMLNKVLHPSPHLQVDGSFGPATESAVKAFQKGEHLSPDGVVGPNTWAALDHKFTSPAPGHTGGTPAPPVEASDELVAEAVRVALSQDGVMEEPLGSNRGPKVDEYNKTAGVPAGSFWCMSFVYWSFVQAAARLGKPNPMPKTAYCPFLYNWAKQHGKLVASPQPGDIFLVKGGPNGHKHTGLVTAPVTAASFGTIEGNTNNDGSHNGIGVFRRTRTVGTCDFVRLAATSGQLAWGAKVSADFKAKVIQIGADLGVQPDYLMACMAFETGETFSPSIKNAAGSGATGLIQFMPSTAQALGTSTSALAAMTAVAQLDYVKKYFEPYRGRLHSLEDVYMAILYPAAIGKGANSTLFQSGTTAYAQNKGFDANQDGVITPAEVSVKVRAKYTKGLSPGYVG